MMRTIAATALIACALLAACKAESNAQHASTGESQVTQSYRAALNGTWMLTHIGETAAPPSPPISLIISADDSVAGRSAVNGYHASLKAEALARGAFAMTPIASTKMAGSTENMKLERAYFESLSRANTWRVENDALTLSAGSSVVLQFRRE